MALVDTVVLRFIRLICEASYGATKASKVVQMEPNTLFRSVVFFTLCIT